MHVYAVCILYTLFTLIVPDNSFNHDIFIIIYMVILITCSLTLHILSLLCYPICPVPILKFSCIVSYHLFLHPTCKRNVKYLVFFFESGYCA